VSSFVEMQNKINKRRVIFLAGTKID